ncbi:MAG: GPW/gp25 family protein [Gemmatimonadetes bacterium]|nr:GPW/gp25 family protein [Gemmatimonadota bacterium]
MTHIAFPFDFDARGRTATSEDEAWVRGLIEQVLFTSPGERVNRPTFGCGLLQAVFEPNNQALAAATQLTVQGALQQTLGDLIIVEAVSVRHEDATLSVTVQYTRRRTQERQVAQFSRPAP